MVREATNPGGFPAAGLVESAFAGWLRTALIVLWAVAGSVSAAAGPINEIALPEDFSSAHSMVIDAAGRVWFAEKVGRKLGVFDPQSKQFSTYTLPPNWRDVGFSKIALGANGDIWFTVNRWAESGEDPRLLGQFTPSDGFFTKYTLSIDSVPEELLIDGQGVIWFLAANKNSLYRVDPVSLAVKGYAIPTANAYPRGLAADASGHIWFVMANANKLGKFVPQQEVFLEYQMPTQYANPAGITIDGEGNVWFVELTTSRIGVFYPDQQRFDEAIIPTPRSSPNSIVADDSGNLWFLEYRGNKVGVFNPKTAVFGEYDIPTFNSLPGDLVIDRVRSTLWFAEGNTEARKLGMLGIEQALASGMRPTNAAGNAAAAHHHDMMGAHPRQGVSWWGWALLLLVVTAAMAGWLRYHRRAR